MVCRGSLADEREGFHKEGIVKTTDVVIIAGIAVALAMLAAPDGAYAQRGQGGRGSGGWGMGSQYQRMYNPASVETLSGTVESVDKVTPMKGMHYGIHLTLKTDKGTVDVHLGPEWYIERQDAKIEKGDTIEVKGSRVSIAGKPAIIAAEVKKGDSTLVLRDANGIPAWAGWRK
jgi:hypothetical protein